ncbi:MAG: hypothetical protein GEV06_18455 [Luteitalea sp.]|nr:hypothetical protein [Luteitalea sp.]
MGQVTRRYFLQRSSTVAAAAALGGGRPLAAAAQRARTSKTPYDFILVEGHRDIYEFNDRFRAGESSPLVDSMLPRYLAGGIDVVIMPVGGTHPELRGGNHKMLEGTLQTLDMILREIAKTGGQAAVIRTKAEIPTKPDKQRVLFFLDMEGAEPI